MDFLANKQFFSKSKRNSWTHISIPICFWMLLMCFVVLPVLTKDTDAQLLSGQRRNETIATGPSSDQGLLSIIRNPGTLTANLSSVAERMLGGIEEKIDARLQAIKARLDEIAAVAKPAIIAAAAGVVALAALIVAFIILHWYDRFRQGRRHRKVLSDLYGHIHQELKENGDLLHKKSSSGTNPDINDDDNNNNHPNQQYLPAELSNNALKASSSYTNPQYNTILVPHDGSEMSDKALTHAIYLSNMSGVLEYIHNIDSSAVLAGSKEGGLLVDWREK
jgi:hypothetical protein